MNNIYQVIFNKSTQQFVVVSELAKSAGKAKTISADTLDISLLLQNFSEKRPLVDFLLNRQVEQPKDIKQVLKEQQILSQAAGNMLGAVSTYAEQKAKETEEEIKQAEAALQAAEKEGNSAKIQEKETAYAEAKARKESWEDGGANKRRMDATVMAITAVLSGGSAGQVAVAALSPELNAQIHELTKDSKTANLLAHAALSALEAKASGTSATAGAIAGAAGEATAMLLAEAVFNKQPNELTTEEKNLLKVAGQLAGAVAGQASGGTRVDTVFGAETAKRAVENNYLFKNEAARKYELEQKARNGTITQLEQRELAEINTLDEVRDIKLVSFCVDKMTSTCREESKQVDAAKASYSGSELSYNYAYPVYTLHTTKYEEDYKKASSFSEQYSILTASKEKAYADFYETTGIYPSWFDRIDVANTVVASIAGTRLATTEPSKTTQVVPKSVSANEKLPNVGNTTNYTVVKIDINGENIWSATKKFTPKENLNEHWNKHKNEFPEFKNSEDYLNFTHQFIKNPPKGTLTKTRANGDSLMYNPDKNIFISITKDGSPRTMFKPENGLEYWEKQK